MRKTLRSVCELEVWTIGEIECPQSVAVSSDYLAVSTNGILRYRGIKFQRGHSRVTVYDLHTVSADSTPKSITCPLDVSIVGIADGQLIGTRLFYIVRTNLPDCKFSDYTYSPMTITGANEQWYTTSDGAIIGPNDRYPAAYSGGCCDIISTGDGAILFDIECDCMFAIGSRVTELSLANDFGKLLRSKTNIFSVGERTVSKLHLNSSRTLWEPVLTNRDGYLSTGFVDDNIMLFSESHRRPLHVADLRCKTIRSIYEYVAYICIADDRIVVRRTDTKDFALLT